MKLFSKKVVPLVVVALLAGGMSLAIAVTNGNSGNQAIVVVNHQDGKHESKTGFSVAKDMGDTVDNQNAAAATSSGCVECHTVAVAVQIVLAENHPSTAAPSNLALAINENCSGCETAAFAYQYYVTTEGPSHFTTDGNQAISSIRAQISDAAGSDASLTAIDGRLGVLFSQLRAAVNQELVEKGVKFTGSAKKDADFAVGKGTPSPSPSESASATPSVSASPTATETSSPSVTSTPSATTGGDAGGATSPNPEPSTSEPSTSPSPSTSSPSPSPTSEPSSSP